MTAIITNLTGTTQLDESAVSEFDTQFRITAGQNDVMTPFCTYKAGIAGASILVNIYPRFAAVTSALSETDPVPATSYSDSSVTFTPQPFGLNVWRTLMSSLTSGGKVDLAIAKAVGLNMGQSMNAQCTVAGEASTNQYIIDGTAAASVGASQTINTNNTMGKIYIFLQRNSVAPHSNGSYISVQHPDVIGDLVGAADAGSWTDVNKYAAPGVVLQNEAGKYKGFTVVSNTAANVVDQPSSGTVDLYKSLFFGEGAFARVESSPAQLYLENVPNQLGMFVSIGWRSVHKYGILDQNSIWTLTTAATTGANAS